MGGWLKSLYPRCSASRIEAFRIISNCQPYFILAFNRVGISLVSRATGTPAASKAATFSAAVPDPLEMIAPAWPICLPLGASRPEMNATTGLVTQRLI